MWGIFSRWKTCTQRFTHFIVRFSRETSSQECHIFPDSHFNSALTKRKCREDKAAKCSPGKSRPFRAFISPNNQESLVEWDRGKVEHRGEHRLGRHKSVFISILRPNNRWEKKTLQRNRRKLKIQRKSSKTNRRVTTLTSRLANLNNPYSTQVLLRASLTNVGLSTSQPQTRQVLAAVGVNWRHVEEDEP